MTEAYNEWQQPAEERPQLTLQEMDDLVIQLRNKRDAYERAKDASNEAHDEYEKQRKVVIDALKSQARTNYSVAGVAQVVLKTKEVYKVPPGTEQKRLLFNYIRGKYGDESLMSMLSINHASLNSWANKETEDGTVMTIPGLEQPTMDETLSITKR